MQRRLYEKMKDSTSKYPIIIYNRYIISIFAFCSSICINMYVKDNPDYLYERGNHSVCRSLKYDRCHGLELIIYNLVMELIEKKEFKKFKRFIYIGSEDMGMEDMEMNENEFLLLVSNQGFVIR